MTMKPKELINILLKKGWRIKRIQGSHYIIENPLTNQTEVIPNHNKDMNPGLLNTLLKRTGLK